jgi:hypothetical protein
MVQLSLVLSNDFGNFFAELFAILIITLVVPFPILRQLLTGLVISCFNLLKGLLRFRLELGSAVHVFFVTL